MAEIAIQIDKISKQYRLGTLNHGTLTKDIQSWWARKIGKEDPNTVVGMAGAVTSKREANTDFWALKDISFEVNKGEVLGVIGRNGAGKSTLLKILSQVTTPTRGEVRLKGRLASLLEVGTGFHPELTGRENIFLNGAILGMRRAEIIRKFDEIVAFAEVEQFIDTPVKRYSSGMYVRLAFAVAAHLEPEILIVDEVLAVGDIQFQKKCLGKMEDVANEGRTILLVSHNMSTILNLSDRVLLLSRGRAIEHGPAYEVVTTFQNEYRNGTMGQTDLTSAEHYGSGLARFRSIRLAQYNEQGTFIPVPETGSNLSFTIEIETAQNFNDAAVALIIYDDLGNRLIDVNTLIKGDTVKLTGGKMTTVEFTLKNVRLKPAIYTVGLWTGVLNQIDIDGVRYATSFRIEARREDIRYTAPFPGVYACEFEHNIAYS